MSRIRLPAPLFTLSLLFFAVLFTSSPGQEKPAPAQQKPAPEKLHLERLVKELGHKSWKRREAAQKELIKAGNEALPLLKKYSSSTDIELARRSRILREKLDPMIFTFQLLEIRLGDQPEILTQYTGKGKNRRAIKLSGKKPKGRNLSSYVISWESNEPGKYQVQVREGASQVNPGIVLDTPLPTSPALSTLKLAEEVRYEHRGVVTSRERFPLARILHQQHQRLSESGETRKTVFSLDLLHRLLFEQAHSDDLSERIEALALLVELAPAEARATFLDALKQPETSSLGALGLAALGEASAPELLVKILEEPASPAGGGPPGKPAGKGPDSRLDAAVALSRIGDLRGVGYLLRKLNERDLVQLFRIISTLADLAPKIALKPELREQFLRLALRDDTITQAPWRFYHYEAQYFFVRAIEILDPENEEHRALAANARGVFEGLALGQYGTTSIPLGAIFPLWQKVHRIAAGRAQNTRSAEEPKEELAFIEKILSKVESSTGLGEIMGRVKSYFSGASIPDPFLILVMKNLVRCGAKGEETLRYAALRGAKDLSSAILLSSGQLKLLLETMAELYEDKANAKAGASLSSTSNLVLPELRRLSGLPLKQSAGSGRRADLAKLRKWLQDETEVSKREKVHLEKQAQAGGTKLTCYEFLLRIKANPESGTAFKLLDGHRHLIEANRPLSYQNRWGERREIRLNTSGGASRPSGTSQVPATYRLNSFNSISEGSPTFISSVRSDSGIKWFEIARTGARARYISPADSTRDQRLILVIPQEEEPPAPENTDGLDEKTDETVETLWKQFLQRHFLKAEENPTARFRSSFLKVQRQLRLPEGISVLKKWQEKNPAVDLAELLHQLGDPSGLEHLTKLMSSSTDTIRIQAGRALCAAGDEAGTDYLLGLAVTNKTAFASNSYNILASFEKYIEKRGVQDERSAKILTLVLGLIDVTRYQSSGFRVIKQAAGQDFGYYTSGISGGTSTGPQLTVTQRRAAAIKAARQWWKDQAGGAGDSDSDRK